LVRRTDVVSIFPDDASLIRLATSLVIEQNDEWLVGRRHLSLDAPAPLLEERGDHEGQEVSSSPRPERPTITPTSYTTSWDLTPCRLRVGNTGSRVARDN